MFKLGEYDEIEAEDIAEYLRDAGIRVDVRTSISASRESVAFIEGKLSELREAAPDEFEAYEQYVEVTNKVLDEGVSQENFMDRFLLMLDPSWNEKRDIITDLMGEDKGLSDEEDEEALEENERLLRELFEYVKGLGFAQVTLDLNEIELEDGVKKSLGDDPVLQLPFDPDEFDSDNPMMKSILEVSFDKTYDLYIDEMTAPLIDDVDEMFFEDYPDESINIRALGMVIDSIFEPPETSKKIDFEDFVDLCAFDVGEGSHIMKVDATPVAEALSKVLEKNGVIKARGGKVKWKKTS